MLNQDAVAAYRYWKKTIKEMDAAYEATFTVEFTGGGVSTANGKVIMKDLLPGCHQQRGVRDIHLDKNFKKAMEEASKVKLTGSIALEVFVSFGKIYKGYVLIKAII
jgi:hypothetical protein